VVDAGKECLLLRAGLTNSNCIRFAGRTDIANLDVVAAGSEIAAAIVYR